MTLFVGRPQGIHYTVEPVPDAATEADSQGRSLEGRLKRGASLAAILGITMLTTVGASTGQAVTTAAAPSLSATLSGTKQITVKWDSGSTVDGATGLYIYDLTTPTDTHLGNKSLGPGSVSFDVPGDDEWHPHTGWQRYAMTIRNATGAAVQTITAQVFVPPATTVPSPATSPTTASPVPPTAP